MITFLTGLLLGLFLRNVTARRQIVDLTHSLQYRAMRRERAKNNPNLRIL